MATLSSAHGFVISTCFRWYVWAYSPNIDCLISRSLAYLSLDLEWCLVIRGVTSQYRFQSWLPFSFLGGSKRLCYAPSVLLPSALRRAIQFLYGAPKLVLVALRRSTQLLASCQHSYYLLIAASCDSMSVRSTGRKYQCHLLPSPRTHLYLKQRRCFATSTAPLCLFVYERVRSPY